MRTDAIRASLTTVFSELVDGAHAPGGAFVLNTGDAGLLASLDRLSAADASQSVGGGATIAAHAQHVRYGLLLMNRWASEGGDPFADPLTEEAWKISSVSDAEWEEIRAGLRSESDRWLGTLGTARDVSTVELSGLVASIADVAYHMGAIRQIAVRARGPRQGTFI